MKFSFDPVIFIVAPFIVAIADADVTHRGLKGKSSIAGADFRNRGLKTKSSSGCCGSGSSKGSSRGSSSSSGSGSSSSSSSGSSSGSSNSSSDGICLLSGSFCERDDECCDNYCYADIDGDRCSCVAGTTGVFRKNKDGDGTMTIVEVANLRPGDLVRGLDEQRMVIDECEVLALDDWGSGDLYGNYTYDHYNFDEEEYKFTVHGYDNGPKTYGEKYSVITSCLAVQDESGIFFSPLDARTVSSDHDHLDWEEYITFYNMVAYFASSHHISTTEYIPFNGGNTRPTSSDFMNCLQDGTSCTAYGNKHIDEMSDTDILNSKNRLESKFGVNFPATSMQDLKSAHRILYQRRIRPMRTPSQEHRLLK